MKVSVIIPTLGRPEMVKRAVASVTNQKIPVGILREIIVVDDGGMDETKRVLKGIRNLRYLWKTHGGPAAARNHGASFAKGEILAFLDSDTVADPRWLISGLRLLQKDASLFGVEGKVMPDPETGSTPFSEVVENRKGGRWLTCNIFVRRKEFLSLGGFDERYKRPMREDTEFAFRALEAGKRFVFEDRAIVRHPVRKISFYRLFLKPREAMYEALLRRTHPQSYRRYLKWIDGRTIPAFYWAHYAAVLLVFFYPWLALLSFVAGNIAVIYVWCRKRHISFRDPFLLIFPAMATPFLRVFWLARGEWKYPCSPE